MRTKCVYLHRRNDTNEVFYVGLGTKKRPYSKANRNIHWQRIVKKAGYTVEIESEELTLLQAQNLERFLIGAYGIKYLSNMTLGGEGVTGYKLSDEAKNQIAKRMRERPLEDYEAFRLSTCKKVIDIDTGYIYSSIKEACLDKNLKYSTVRNQIGGFRKRNDNNKLYKVWTLK